METRCVKASVMYGYKYHFFLFGLIYMISRVLLSACVSTSCTLISLYKNAAMLRYNHNFLPIENQRPRCNKMATRMGFVSTPEAFTPGSEDWSPYAQRFQHFLLVNGITEESQKLHLLLALVGNSTFRLLTNLVAPRQPGELMFKEAVTELGVISNPSPLKSPSASDPTSETSRRGRLCQSTGWNYEDWRLHASLGRL